MHAHVSSRHGARGHRRAGPAAIVGGRTTQDGTAVHFSDPHPGFAAAVERLRLASPAPEAAPVAEAPEAAPVAEAPQGGRSVPARP
jgi:hypothetical protein